MCMKAVVCKWQCLCTVASMLTHHFKKNCICITFSALESGQRISHHLTYYINRYKLQPDYNETDILSTIQHVLESLASGNPLSLVVLKELNAFIKDKRDIATLLAGLGVTAGTSYMKGYNSSGETLIQKLNTTKPKCPDTPPNLCKYNSSVSSTVVRTMYLYEV